MKYFLLLILIFCDIVAKNSFEIKPIILNFKGIEAHDSILIAYGDNGSILFSNDFASTWSQKKIFNNGDVISISLETDRIVAFSNDGQIASSNDNGMNWTQICQISDSVNYIIKLKDGYYLSVKSGLLNLSLNFERLNSFKISNSSFTNFSQKYQSEFGQIFQRHNLAVNDNKIIFLNDSNSTIYRYDKNLRPIDTIQLCNVINSKNYNNLYSLFNDSEYIYLQLSDSVYKSKDLIHFEYVFHYNFHPAMFGDSSVPYFHKIINNKLYCATSYYIYKPLSGPYLSLYEVTGKDSAVKLGSLDCSMPPTNGGTQYYILFWNDFCVDQNRFTVVMNKKFINSVNLNTNKQSRICEMLDLNNELPDNMNDSSFIFYNSDYQLFKTFNTGTTFLRELGDSVFFRPHAYFYRYFKSYFVSDSLLVLGGIFYNDSIRETIAVSHNDGKTFSFKKVPNINFSLSLSNLLYSNKNYILAQNLNYGKSWKTTISIFDKNFDSLNTISDSLFCVNALFSNGNASYYAITSNPDSSSELKYTNNFTEWKSLKKYYSYTDSIFLPDGTFLTALIYKELWYWKEITIKNKKYLSLLSFDKKDLNLKFELFDLDNNTFNELYNQAFQNYKVLHYAFDCFQDTLYLAINDTIFIFNDLTDKSKLFYYLLPDKGSIQNKYFKKFGKGFFVSYIDSLYSFNEYLITPSGIPDSILVSVDNSSEAETSYMFSYPPFPIPASNRVKSLIYWDNTSDIDGDEMGCYNIFGEKIAGRERITIDKLNSYSGYLTWDCSDVPAGIYLIRLRHGTTVSVIKTIIVRE